MAWEIIIKKIGYSLTVKAQFSLCLQGIDRWRSIKIHARIYNFGRPKLNCTDIIIKQKCTYLSLNWISVAMEHCVRSDNAVGRRIGANYLEFDGSHTYTNKWKNSINCLQKLEMMQIDLPPRTMNVSSLWIGRYASKKYGLRYTSNKFPVKPSTVSSMGRMCTRVPYLTSGHDWIDTMSDRWTRKLLRTTRFMRIFSLGQFSSESTMHTVSLRRRPFNSTVSPRNSWSSSILACDKATTELSSFNASSTNSRLGRSLRFRMAVARSSLLMRRICITFTNQSKYKCG